MRNKFALCVDGTAKKINGLRVSDAISKIANKTDAASAYRGGCAPAPARACVRESVYRTNVNEYVCS